MFVSDAANANPFYISAFPRPAFLSDLDEGLRDGQRRRHHVLQGFQRHIRHIERRRLQPIHETARRDHAQVRFAVWGVMRVHFDDAQPTNPFQKRVGHKKSRGYPFGARVHCRDDAVDARRGDRSVGRQGRESGSVS